jgi:hypothetical protein
MKELDVVVSTCQSNGCNVKQLAKHWIILYSYNIMFIVKNYVDEWINVSTSIPHNNISQARNHPSIFQDL